tara:strand:+ start:1061 stop:1966 length:906 start_codon:yes stop_codon:yes gene_type:complete
MKKLFDLLILKFILRSKINIWLGKIIFKNSGGLVSNSIGAYIKRRDPYKAKKLGFHKKENSMVDSLKEKGFLILDDLQNEKTISQLSVFWNKYADQQEPPESGRLELSSVDNEKDEDRLIPLLEDLITEDIQIFLESYFGSYSRIINYHLYRNRKPPHLSELDSYGATANWHTDGSTSESIKLFFMLSDVTENNGPMEAISIEDSRNVFMSNKFSYPDNRGETRKFINEKAQIFSFQGKAGSLYYALTNDALHRATIPKDGEYRDLLVFYITSSYKKRSVNQQLKEANYREIYGLQRLFIS